MLAVQLKEKNPNAECKAPIVIDDTEMEEDICFLIRECQQLSPEQRDRLCRFAWRIANERT